MVFLSDPKKQTGILHVYVYNLCTYTLESLELYTYTYVIIQYITQYMGLSENVGYIPNEIAIKKRDNDQQNHWVQWGTNLFSDTPKNWDAHPGRQACTEAGPEKKRPRHT